MGGYMQLHCPHYIHRQIHLRIDCYSILSLANMSAQKKPYADTTGNREYKYSQEISQMMFVFGEVQDPNPETVNLVEVIIRSQLIELVSQAVLLYYVTI